MCKSHNQISSTKNYVSTNEDSLRHWFWIRCSCPCNIISAKGEHCIDNKKSRHYENRCIRSLNKRRSRINRLKEKFVGTLGSTLLEEVGLIGIVGLLSSLLLL